MPQLNYSRAEILRGRIADLLQEMSAFTDAEEDRIEDGADEEEAERHERVGTLGNALREEARERHGNAEREHVDGREPLSDLDAHAVVGEYGGQHGVERRLGEVSQRRTEHEYGE